MASAVQLHVGFDDTDSLAGGCTTYLASLAIDAMLRDFGARFVDYPLLVRLNPNIPWKTRGNGAVCLRAEVPGERVDELKRCVIGILEAHSHMGANGTDPAVVFSDGAVDDDFEDFYDDALRKVIGVGDALRFADEKGCEVHAYGTKRGVVGCLAAIGSRLGGDHTFELISYRDREHLGRTRLLDLASVFEMDARAHGTFNNLDPETGRILIAPHGYDPVLMGIRGESPLAVLEAFREVRCLEPVERWMIFRSNQGTDAHLPSVPAEIASVGAYESVCIDGSVDGRPRRIPGGHVLFTMGDRTGEIECAAYEPTGSLRELASALLPGDRVRVYGGVRLMDDGSHTLNVEKLQVVELGRTLLYRPPICPRCGIRCDSSGLRQGYRCRKCGLWRKWPERHAPDRRISVGTFIPPPRAHRHLTKPASRYGLEKHRYSPVEPAEPWHMP
jgi:tRNA(Ile2)-agmatinylcytidine synthase